MKHRPFRGVVNPKVGSCGSVERFLAPVFAEEKREEELSQYIIWNPTSPLVPKVIQPSRPEAIRIAGRMAHENPGQTFYVCKLVNSACKPIPVDVKYEDLDR